jgi:hypothetical protein
LPNTTAQYPTLTVVSQYGATQSDAGEVFVPAASESFGHDLDGNLTSDGRWTLYTCDGVNVHSTSEVRFRLRANIDPSGKSEVRNPN